jgi:hypothetical protein
VGAIYNGKKQTRWENANQATKVIKMNYGEKMTTQRILLMGANRGLNNKKIAS